MFSCGNCGKPANPALSYCVFGDMYCKCEKCGAEGLATMVDPGDTLCDFCPLPDELKGVHSQPSGYHACEGRRCGEAYEIYRERAKEPNQ